MINCYSQIFFCYLMGNFY